MSRLYTWDSSWPITPRSSRVVSSWVMPSVTQTAACCGLRPVANALGCGVGLTYSRGIGCPAGGRQLADHRVQLRGLASVTGWARIERSAILSE